MPLKRFLSLYGEEFSKKHPDTFKTICKKLVWELRCRLDSPVSQKLLLDLVGQPSLLTPVAFTWGFLNVFVGDIDRANFVKYGYKEATEEGLKGEHEYGGRDLWRVMVSNYPTRFFGEYPSTNKARNIALKDLPTKQDREEAWAEKNAPSLRVKLEEFMPGLFPPVPLTIISEYAITWISVLPSPLQRHSNVEAQGSVPGMFSKLQSGETRLDGIAAQPKAVQNAVDKATEPLSTKRQPLESIVNHSGLSSIDPYDDNPDTKYYLDLGCDYLALNHSKKYETESVQEKQGHVYYRDCLGAVWSGSSFKALPSNECHLKQFDSFAKGDVLTHPGKQPPTVAHDDGFMLLSTKDYSLILYYHKDKPPMNLDVLSRLRWPHSRDLLSFTNTDIKTYSARSRKGPSNQFDATIKLDSEHVKSITFADLKRWVQCFDLSRYDPAKLKTFREQLSLDYPGIHLTKIHRVETKTSIEPLYNPFSLILPGNPIAFRYDPDIFTLPENIISTRYSTIITDFKHQGSKYCLVLSFDVLIVTVTSPE